MRTIDSYISEKLKINKDSKLEIPEDKNSPEYVKYLLRDCKEHFYIEDTFNKHKEEYVRLLFAGNDIYKIIEKLFDIRMEKHSSENYIAIGRTNRNEWYTCFSYKTPGGSVVTDYQFTDTYDNPDDLIDELLTKFEIKH